MKSIYLKPLVLIGILFVATCAALAFTHNSRGTGPIPTPPQPPTAAHQPGLTANARLVQTKVLTGSDGLVSMSLTLTADETPGQTTAPGANVDLVIVLDRSGSMNGQKIDYAKRAVLDLLANLSPKDRLALVTYSTEVNRQTGLLPATEANRQLLSGLIQRVTADGTTNLGGGLEAGLDILMTTPLVGNLGKVILVSDGLANRGITDPAELGRMAAKAIGREFGVSTVGVGTDFNEQLMTMLADQGGGMYHYLSNPMNFAEVFQKEFHQVRTAAATGLEVRVPLAPGISLVDAGGYPIEVKGNQAVFHPGDLRAGSSRTLFLTFRLPTQTETEFQISGLSISYLRQGQSQNLTLPGTLSVACVKDKKSVLASYDRGEWEKKVVREDFNKLKEQVAKDVKEGKRDAAMRKIEEYSTSQSNVNSVLGSTAVEQNLKDGVDDLRQKVTESFAGPPAAAAEKQKSNAKTLQYDGYAERRALK